MAAPHSYRAENDTVIRIGFAHLSDEPISNDEAVSTRARMIIWSNRCVDNHDFTAAENADAIVKELTAAIESARLWREQRRKVA